MRPRLIPILLLPLLLSSQPLFADSITLKTGETVTGTIKSETDTEVTIEVPVSAAITDERVIEKSDIAKEDKAQPDDIAYQQLSQIQPNPQYSYTTDQYTQILASLNGFLTSYPTSSHAADIKKMVATFQAEKNHVDAGQYKYLGRWISQQEAASRSVQIQGMQYYATMQQQAASGDFVGAMQTFATLERNCLTTRSYPAAVELAKQVVARIKQVTAQTLIQYKAQQQQLQQTIAFTTEPEKSSLIQQAKAEQDRAAAVVAAALRSGSKWVPLIADSSVSIQTLQSTANSEAGRLGGIPTQTMNLSIAKVDAARASMDAGNLKQADDQLTEALSLWVQNEDARYTLTQLKGKIQAAAPVIAKETPKPTPTPTPHMVNIVTSATPAPEEDKPFYMTVPGALAIAAVVLILGGGITIMGQKKKRAQEEEE